MDRGRGHLVAIDDDGLHPGAGCHVQRHLVLGVNGGQFCDGAVYALYIVLVPGLKYGADRPVVTLGNALGRLQFSLELSVLPGKGLDTKFQLGGLLGELGLQVAFLEEGILECLQFRGRGLVGLGKIPYPPIQVLDLELQVGLCLLQGGHF